jgi:hypothetical protein
MISSSINAIVSGRDPSKHYERDLGPGKASNATGANASLAAGGKRDQRVRARHVLGRQAQS